MTATYGVVRVPALAGEGSAGISPRKCMKVGDLVRWKGSVGIVVEIGKFVGNGDLLVKWHDHPDPLPARSDLLELLTSA
tara:strand:+ start:15705 stop:15941 length:237 start_codon:yes stop_codon:yes gene_type:complete